MTKFIPKMFYWGRGLGKEKRPIQNVNIVCLQILGTQSSEMRLGIIVLEYAIWQMTSYKRLDNGG